MKNKTFKLALSASIFLTTSAFATNGDHLIGIGAQSIGMGGTGIAFSHGAESALSNPALITTVVGTEITFGGTAFSSDVSTQIGNETAHSSQAPTSMIPTVAIAHNFGDGLSVGVGMHGVAGMGVDYRDADGAMFNNFNMVTSLQLMQFVAPIAYKYRGLSIAVEPILQYGALDINYMGSSTQGTASDFGYGYTLGTAYEISDFTIGASYKSSIDMEYNGVISQAMSDFTGAPASMMSDHLEQPSEMGVGISYRLQNHALAVDYKRIGWSDAKGYKDFQWADQNVFAIGYEYSTSSWALRTGFNYAASPISEQPLQTSIINALNLVGFPATTTSHYTAGGSYKINEQLSFDLGFMYAPEVSDTFSAQLHPMLPAMPITSTHSQFSTTGQLKFTF